MTIHIANADSDSEIASTFEVMRQLRPNLQQSSYVTQIRGLMASDGINLLMLVDSGEVRAVAAYRLMNMLYCGRIICIDDLISDERARSRGYGSKLIAHLAEVGRELGCSEIQLISRTTREQAHKFYFREGFGIECFHFRRKI